jgi:hypothetical protein
MRHFWHQLSKLDGLVLLYLLFCRLGVSSARLAIAHKCIVLPIKWCSGSTNVNHPGLRCSWASKQPMEFRKATGVVWYWMSEILVRKWRWVNTFHALNRIERGQGGTQQRLCDSDFPENCKDAKFNSEKSQQLH